jgi:hypothetical protein
MNNETTSLPSPEEARAALAEAERAFQQTRVAIVQGPSAPLLILWGSIWMIADLTTQFYAPAMLAIWLPLDLIGGGGTWWIVAHRRVKVGRHGNWRYGAFWGVLFFYAALWTNLLVPVSWPQNAHDWATFEPVFRRITAYYHTIPMFAYVLGGLFIGRFFVILGALVTALIVIGFCFIHDYFYLWMAITGGGSLIISGVFIRQFWK